MADNDQQTSTVATETEAPNKVTDTEGKKDSEVPAAGTAAADDVNAPADEGTEDGKSGKDEGDDSAPAKNANRQQYKVRRLVSDNPGMRALRERLQPFVDDADDPSISKDRQRDVDDYIRQAGQAQAEIQRDNESVQREIPIFNPESPDFRQDLASRAYAQYARDMCIEDQNGAVDANGNPVIVGYRMSLLDYMREKAEDYGFGSMKPESGKQPAKKSKSKAKAKMDAAADTPSGASAAAGSNKDDEDPFLAGFNDPYGRHAPTNAHTWSEK